MANPGTFPSEPIITPVRSVEQGWIDYNGHMNVAYYSLAFDQSLDHVLEFTLDVGPSFVAEHGHGPYVVQNHIHYLSELLEGDRFFVRFLLVDADNKRVHCFLEMVRESSSEVVATSEQLLVNVDLETRRSASYPRDRQDRIRALLEAHSVLPHPERLGARLGIRRRPRSQTD